MAEVLGIVASIISLCELTAEGVKLVWDLYKAPKEITELLVGTRRM